MLISISELINKALQLYKNNFALFLKYIAINAIVPVVVSLLMSSAILFAPALLVATNSNILISILLAIIIIALAIGVAYLTSWFSFALIKVINDRQLGLTDAGFIQNFKSMRPLVWRGFGASILVSLISGAPFFIALLGVAISTITAKLTGGSASTFLSLLFSLIGLYGFFHLIYFGIKLQFSIYGVLFENKKIKESIKYSSDLVRGNWWPIFGRMFVSGLVLWLVVIIATAILNLLGGIGDNSIIKLVFSIITSIFSILVWQAIMMVMIILYNDLKKLASGTQAPVVVDNEVK